MSPRHTLVVLLPLTAVLITGCGGGGGDSTGSVPATTTATTTALSKEELVQQGDAICAEVNAAVGIAGASSAETGSQVAQAADLYSGMIGSLKNLGTPQETAGYPEFIAAAEALSTAEDEVKLASERGDAAGLETAESSASSALSSFQSAAQEYGFEDCGEGPSAPSASATTTTPSSSSEAAPEETPEAAEAEPEATAEPAPETGGAGGTAEGTGGGTAGGTEGGGTSGGGSGGIGPG